MYKMLYFDCVFISRLSIGDITGKVLPTLNVSNLFIVQENRKEVPSDKIILVLDFRCTRDSTHRTHKDMPKNMRIDAVEFQYKLFNKWCAITLT